MAVLNGVALILIGLAGAFAESISEDVEKKSIPGIDAVIQHAKVTAAESGIATLGDDEPLLGGDRRLWSCTDEDWGARDSGDDGCWYYVNYPSACGAYDDWDFWAYDLCCACGGGEVRGGCTDQDWGARDSGDDGCGYYYDFPSDCGAYDDWNFWAYDMCCACGGGGGYYSYVAASEQHGAASAASVNDSGSDLSDSDSGRNSAHDEPLAGDDRRLWSCTDEDWGARDSGDDGCWYYVNYPSACGAYDDWDFWAYDLCCACGGGEVRGGCTDQDWGARDSGDDGCGYYYDFPSDCGAYDDWNFWAYDMCCACGGGGGYYNYVAASDDHSAASAASVNDSTSDLNDSASDLNDSASDPSDSVSARKSGCIGLRGCR